MSSIKPTRRHLVIGAASSAAIVGMSTNATAFFWTPWITGIGSHLIGGWLLEALKNWGLVPHGDAGAQGTVSSSVQDSHTEAVESAQREGFNTEPLYHGKYPGGDLLVHKATKPGDFKALITSSHLIGSHGNSICTQRFDGADAMNFGVSSNALRQEGLSTGAIQGSMLPIHPPGTNQFVGSRRYSPTLMTPSGGTISWSTDFRNPQPNFITSIQSDDFTGDLHLALLDDGSWTYDIA